MLSREQVGEDRELVLLTLPFELFEGTEQSNDCLSVVAAQGRMAGRGRRWAVSQLCMITPRPTLTPAHTLWAWPFRNRVPQNDVSALCNHAIPGAGSPLCLWVSAHGAHRNVSTLVPCQCFALPGHYWLMWASLMCEVLLVTF